MMATRKYTIAELVHLRDSPKVEKPANLPAIEQWLEYVYLEVDGAREKLRIPRSETAPQEQQQQQHQKRQNVAGRQTRQGTEASPMGNFSTGQRPSLMQTRSAARSGGEFGTELVVSSARLTRSVEDVTLGPPKMLFTSSRNVSKLSDFGDKPTTPSAEDALNDQENQPRSRFFDKQGNRKSMNTSGETDGKLNRESWTEARQRRNQAAKEEEVEGGERNGKYGRRDREQDGERRNGFGDRQDNRWGARDDRRQNGERQGGWRERDRQRQDRDWDRGHNGKEPEWMEDPAPTQEEDFSSMSMPKNQEEFEKWKQAQHARNKQSVEEPLEMAAEPPPPPPPTRESAPARSVAPLKLDSIMDKPFRGFGDVGRQGSTPDSSSFAKSGSAGTAKGKQSRFMSMFKKDEPSEASPAPESAPPPVLSDAPPKDTAEDKEGFQRILQMLGGASIGGAPQAMPQGMPQAIEPASPPPMPRQSTGGKPKSRFTGFFDQAAKSPERLQSPPSGGEGPFTSLRGEMFADGPRPMGTPNNMFGGQLSGSQAREQAPKSRPQTSAMSPHPILSPDTSRDAQRPQSTRMNDIFMDQPPSRGASTPDINIQNLLASQRIQRPQGQDKNSAFLLDLMKGGSRPASQQARPDANFPIWVDTPPSMPEPHAPKPRAPPPPGLLEDQLFRGHPQDMPRHEPQPPMPNPRMSQRPAPPGFLEEQSYLMQQQQQHQQQREHRRNFTEPPTQQHHMQQQQQRRISGHPSQQLQTQFPQHNPPPVPPFPQEFLQSPVSGGAGQAPPPGFNAHMPRHPPGIHNEPRIFMPPSQPPFPLQNPPPGFFGAGGGAGPPGFAQQMQMRSPNGEGGQGQGQVFMGPRR